MTSNLEQRLYRLETTLIAAQNQIAQLLARVAALEQQKYAAGGGGAGGGGGGGTYFGCTLGTALAHASSVTGQTVWKLVGGTRTTISTNATIYNDAPRAADDIPSSTQVILNTNDDGTYTVISVPC